MFAFPGSSFVKMWGMYKNGAGDSESASISFCVRIACVRIACDRTNIQFLFPAPVKRDVNRYTPSVMWWS